MKARAGTAEVVQNGREEISSSCGKYPARENSCFLMIIEAAYSSGRRLTVSGSGLTAAIIPRVRLTRIMCRQCRTRNPTQLFRAIHNEASQLGRYWELGTEHTSYSLVDLCPCTNLQLSFGISPTSEMDALIPPTRRVLPTTYRHHIHLLGV